MNRKFRASITSAAVAGLLSGTNVALKAAVRLSVMAASLAATLSSAQGAPLTSTPANAAAPANPL